MSGSTRRLKRSIMRKQYERFCQAWSNEKTYQQFLLAAGQPLPEGHNQLGRKPTFAMWMRAMEQRRAQQAAAAVAEQDPKQVQIRDTEWEE